MRSTTFSCEKTLFKKDLSRFWPLWVGYTVLWFLLLPMQVFGMTDSLRQSYLDYGLTGWVGNIAMERVCGFNLFGSVGTEISLLYGVLCAMAVWSYLYSTRAVNMTHTLPVRRGGHFAAHFLSGVAFFALPHSIIFVLTVVAGEVRGSSGGLGGIAAAMGILTLLCLFFFSFATLCAFVTGHVLALPVLYVIINFLVYGVTELANWVSGRFLFGVTSGLERIRHIVIWLTPFAKLIDNLSFRYAYEGKGTTGTSNSIRGIPTPSEHIAGEVTVRTQLEGLSVVFVYAAVGVVLAALALLLYRRRHLETAGDVVAVPWLRPVFQYGVAFCAALAGSYITADILREDKSPVMLTALLAVWGIIGYFAARMLLHKTLKVFRSGWKGAVATAAVLLVLCAGLWVDVFGLESRVPDASQVGSIYINGPESNPGDGAYSPGLIIDDPAQIEQILKIHRAVVAHRAELKAAQTDWGWDSLAPSTHLRIMYYANAVDEEPFMERNYSKLVLSEEDLNDPESVAYALNEYINDPAVISMAYRLDEVEPGRMTQVLVNGLSHDDSDEVEYVLLYSPLSDYALSQSPGQTSSYEVTDYELPAVAIAEPTKSYGGTRRQAASMEELGKLWAAVLADFEEGNLGRRWLFNSEEFRKNTCVNSLEFFYQIKVERPGREDFYRENVVSVQLTPSARHTLAAMEKLGLFKDGAYVSGMGDEIEHVYPKK